jgi:hypothetical protein
MSTFICPHPTVLLVEKAQIDTASRNKLTETKFMESELVLRLVLIIRFEAIEMWYRCLSRFSRVTPSRGINSRHPAFHQTVFSYIFPLSEMSVAQAVVNHLYARE